MPTSGAYYSRDELAALVDDLTVEDVRRSRQEFPDDPPQAGFAAVYHAAQRTGLANGEDLSGFLSRVRLNDLGPLLEANRAPKLPSNGELPASADSGG